MFSGEFANTQTVYLVLSNLVILIIAVVFSTNIYKTMQSKVKNLNFKALNLTLCAFRLFLILLFVVSLSFMVGGTYNPFLYFRF